MISTTFYKDDRLVLGIKTNKGILDVEAASLKFPFIQDLPKTVSELISHDTKAKQALSRLMDLSALDDSLYLPDDQLDYGPCVPEPQKIIGIGLNYRKHAIECNLPFPQEPILFGRFSNTIQAHGKEIILPSTSTQMDYEAELAIVIGKKGKNIKKEKALSFVYGYCIANDVTARDLQFKSSQWLLGKNCDQCCPIGPYLISSDEIENPNNLNITTYVNGEIRQNSNTSDMIFNCEEIISYISEHFTLEPGDIILTGTPEGVILGYPEEKRIWLKDGDVVTIEIEKLGRLSNTFRKGSVPRQSEEVKSQKSK